MAGQITITGIEGIPEVEAGADLPRLILEATARQGIQLIDGDILAVTQKVVSKAEGRFVELATVEPSPFVWMDHGVIICETRHGFVCANAGVDASNVPGGRLILLPVDPDASARRIRAGIKAVTGADVAVIISDTFGRPWRSGYTEVAIGVAGMLPILDYVGQADTAGRELRATWICVADELASAAELVTGKVNQIPVTLIRGYVAPPGDGSARDIVRQAETDMFR
jgi:coenzyme F420-0:L-glutamate ligase/coenzyme F420-1:gamma-L-glutamate ligase